jgi:hypothetical protein
MALSANLERLSYAGPTGCVATGLHREVVSVTASTTLTAEQSGALVLLAVASGATLTLPSAAEGMHFEVGVQLVQDHHGGCIAVPRRWLHGG